MTNKQKGITNASGFKGKVDITPRLILDALGDTQSAICYVSAKEIISFLIAPVIEVNNKCLLKQEIRDGWGRVLKDLNYKDLRIGAKCLLVSPRNNWKLFNNKLNIIETAYIIDGANYLNYLASNKISEKIPMIVLFGASEDDELIYRQNTHKEQNFSIFDIRHKVGTEAPRLIIDDKWKQIKIISDPFVVKTSRGYVAAINIINTKNNLISHIIVGAKSITEELEPLREKLGTLVGLEIKIRKQSSDPQSLYEISII